jgi:hypothetical protein
MIRGVLSCPGCRSRSQGHRHDHQRHKATSCYRTSAGPPVQTAPTSVSAGSDTGTWAAGPGVSESGAESCSSARTRCGRSRSTSPEEGRYPRANRQTIPCSRPSAISRATRPGDSSRRWPRAPSREPGTCTADRNSELGRRGRHRVVRPIGWCQPRRSRSRLWRLRVEEASGAASSTAPRHAFVPELAAHRDHLGHDRVPRDVEAPGDLGAGWWVGSNWSTRSSAVDRDEGASATARGSHRCQGER